MRRQLYKTRNFRIRNLHQRIMILGYEARLIHPLAPLNHTDHKVKPTIPDERTYITGLNHDRRQEWENLLIKEIMDKLFMERFRLLILV